MATSSLQRNFVYNLVGAIVPLATTVVTVPAYLAAIGTARLGVMSLVWLLFGYFGLFDFGLSRATANRLAQLRGGDPRERATVFYTALATNLVLGMLAAAAFYFTSSFLIFKLSRGVSSVAAELPSALPWFVALFPLAMVGNVFVGSLEAEERFLTINVQQIISTALFQCLPLIAVFVLGPTLHSIAMGAIAARATGVALYGVSAMRSMHLAGYPRPSFSLRVGRSLLSYGGWITVTNAVSPVLESADQFIIGSLLGIGNVAYYSVPFTLAMKALIVPGAVTRTLFPRLSSLASDSASTLADRASLTLAGVMTLICAPAIILVHQAMSLWLGPDFSRAASPVAQILLVGTWANGMAFVPFALLQGQGRPDVVAKFHVAEILPFLLVLWALVHWFGLAGAAWAWTLRVTADALLLFLATGNIARRLRGVGVLAAVVLGAWIAAVCLRPSLVVSVVLAVGLFGALVVHLARSDDAARDLAQRCLARVGLFATERE